MPLTNTQHNSIMRIYDNIRTQNQHILDQRIEEVYALCPQLKEVEDRIITVSMSAATARINKSTPETDYVAELDALNRMRTECLASIGTPANYLDAIYMICLLYIPIIIGDGIDAIIGKGNVIYDVLKESFLKIIIVTLVIIVSQFIITLINNKITYGVCMNIRLKSIRKIQKLPLKYIDSHSYGDVISRIINDVDQFSDGLLMGFNQLFIGALTIIGTLILMFTINVLITILVAVLTPISLFVAKFIASRSYNYFLSQANIKGKQSSFIDEMIGNQKVVQAFSQTENNQITFDEMNKELKDISLKAIFYSSLTNPCTRFVNSLVYAVVALAGSITVLNNPLFTIGSLSALLSYANQYTKPFNEISSVIAELQNALASFSRVYEFLNEDEEINSHNHVKLDNALGVVDFENVSFSYNENQKLIENFNLHVSKGKKVAIVGPTGSGKTTLINLLMRFYDVNKGQILVDGIDITEISRSNLRENYGMVLQDTWLRKGTIKENIAFGNPNATDDEIIEAAKLSYAHSFIKRLPNGYDTIIGEDGGNLSAGEKQLLCITRVMLRMPPILILDEATSSIDTRTEIKIQDAFSKLMKGKTSFIVAHRLSTIKNADLILVMKDGNIVEKGTHKELLKGGGFYSELYKSQFDV